MKKQSVYPYTWNADEIVITDVNGEGYLGTHLEWNKPRRSIMLYGYLFYSSIGEYFKGTKIIDTDCIKEIKVLKRGRWYNVPIPEQGDTLIPVEFIDGAKKLVSIREFARIIRRFPESLATTESSI